MSKGAVVAITEGVHAGLYARIVSSGGINDNLRLVVRLTMNGAFAAAKRAHRGSLLLWRASSTRGSLLLLPLQRPNTRTAWGG
eukprot:4354797-Prymnesium_polylepis.2